YDGLQKFGLGAKTGLGFPGEIAGWLPGRNQLTPLRVANLAFGQGLFSTPLQIAQAYAVLANGGMNVKLRLLKSQEADASFRIVDQEVVEKVQAALEAVVADPKGTGVSAAVPGYRIAGKTATAQVIDPATRRYSREHYIASFVGFLRDPEHPYV